MSCYRDRPPRPVARAFASPATNVFPKRTAETSAILDDQRLTVDILMSLAKPMDCASIASLADTSAVVRELMREAFFWHALGRMRGYAMPSEQQVGMSPYQIFWAACMEDERDQRRRRDALDDQLRTAVRLLLWNDASIAVRAGADPNADIGGGRTPLDALMRWVEMFQDRGHAERVRRVSALPFPGSEWELALALSERGGRLSTPPNPLMFDPERFTLRAVKSLNVDGMRFVLRLGLSDVPRSEITTLTRRSSPPYRESRIMDTGLGRALLGWADPPQGSLALVRRVGAEPTANDVVNLVYLYSTAHPERRVVMRERVLEAFAGGDEIVAAFEAGDERVRAYEAVRAAIEESRTRRDADALFRREVERMDDQVRRQEAPDPAPAPTPAARETERFRLAYDSYAPETAERREELRRETQRSFEEAVARFDGAGMTTARQTMKIHEMIDDRERGEEGRARARRRFREWLAMTPNLGVLRAEFADVNAASDERRGI